MPDNTHPINSIAISPDERIHRAFSRMTRPWLYANVRRAIIGKEADFLDTGDFHLIDELYTSGDTRPSNLATIFGLTAPAITKRIRHLHSNKVIETYPDPSDGRATLIRLTPYGVQLAEKIREHTSQAFSTITQTWERSKVEEFASYMEEYATSAVELTRSIVEECKP